VTKIESVEYGFHPHEHSLVASFGHSIRHNSAFLLTFTIFLYVQLEFFFPALQLLTGFPALIFLYMFSFVLPSANHQSLCTFNFMTVIQYIEVPTCINVMLASTINLLSSFMLLLPITKCVRLLNCHQALWQHLRCLSPLK
jgi:hypothetical protein